ncbi:hypothetical protein QR680_018308 [Steinernema hermaphroditum]|uniref:FMRFamide-related peptide FLP-18 n=1 Tax=Steinernema hermaphroditum TaxID=289476 RepID=A0AA39HHJ4_9BILA|nr:hypothetical protein QR680_018308 [Steinernema hermaphroditum]
MLGHLNEIAVFGFVTLLSLALVSADADSSDAAAASKLEYFLDVPKEGGDDMMPLERPTWYDPEAYDTVKRAIGDETSMPGVLRFGKRGQSFVRFGRLDKKEMPGVLRFGKRGEKKAVPGVLRFGKREIPGVLRFGKRDDIPGVLRFGKKSEMPGVLRFGKRNVPGVLRFGRK